MELHQHFSCRQAATPPPNSHTHTHRGCGLTSSVLADKKMLERESNSKPSAAPVTTSLSSARLIYAVYMKLPPSVTAHNGYTLRKEGE